MGRTSSLNWLISDRSYFGKLLFKCSAVSMLCLNILYVRNLSLVAQWCFHTLHLFKTTIFVHILSGATHIAWRSHPIIYLWHTPRGAQCQHTPRNGVPVGTLTPTTTHASADSAENHATETGLLWYVSSV